MSASSGAIPHSFVPTAKQIASNATLGQHPEGPIALYLAACVIEPDLRTERSIARSTKANLTIQETSSTKHELVPLVFNKQ
jgi:hypothetical protein